MIHTILLAVIGFRVVASFHSEEDVVVMHVCVRARNAIPCVLQYRDHKIFADPFET